ncbi:MAG: pyridoxine 5'-phosphate synthase [Crocinitomicaceae bacterium]|jgi:pyridoxine 5-phosphate synthase|nr:pyridoxine 5'-phosphate synthase [Crocinitomicaceae bacterium]MCF8444689.1 pyridoxine 5'-phosphate synthase [Crocinitomicaceae bacterium]
MTKLSVNINKIATIRNARGGVTPNVVQVAIDCERFGAQGITVHPRPDERHITLRDVYELKDVVTTEFNIEGFPDERFMKIIKDIQPQQATLVPDPPGVLTSNAGWNVIENKNFLQKIIAQLQDMGVRTSLFLGTEIHQLEMVKEIGADRIELYTGPFAENYTKNKELAVSDFILTAQKAYELALGVNAGHDLSLDNLSYLIHKIPFIDEVSIGHALISDSLYLGLENTIQRYLLEIEKGLLNY